MDKEKEYFDFSEALRLAKEGWIIGNDEWGDGKTFYVYKPKKFQTMSNSFACIDEQGIGILPWTPDQFDLMSEYYYKIMFSTEDYQ